MSAFAQDLRINEVVSSNKASLLDEDGNAPDWIEIFNASGGSVVLENWRLSDGVDTWAFPNETLVAGGRRLVFASNKDRRVAGAPLHTNFKLASSGETLTLLRPDGSVADRFDPIPSLLEDEAYGIPNGGGDPTWLAQPTPNAANTGAAGKVVFSERGKLFAGTQFVTLLSSVPGMTIRYTTDGSTPSSTSAIANGAVSFSTSTVLKTRGYLANGSAGAVQTERFIKLNDNVLSWSSDLPIVVVDTYGQVLDQIDPALKFGYVSVIDTNALANTSLIDPADYSGPTGIKIRGASSGTFAKKQFKLELWNENTDGVDAKLLGMGKESDWVLYAPGRMDRNMIANAFAFDMIKQMGRNVLSTRYVEVFYNTGATVSINDYQGLYILIESVKIDKKRVDIDKLDPTDNANPEVTGGYVLQLEREGEQNQAIIGSTEQLLAYDATALYVQSPKADALSGPQLNYISQYVSDAEDALYSGNYESLQSGYEAWFDVPSFIDYHINHLWIDDPDFSVLSFFMMKPREGKLLAGPYWDYDRTMGSDDSRDDDPRELVHMNDNGPYFTHRWWGRFYNSVEYRTAFWDRWYELRKTVLSDANVAATAERHQAEIDQAYLREDARWGTTPGYGSRFGDLNGEIDALKFWLSERMDQIDISFERPPNISPNSQIVSAGQSISISTSGQGGTIYYTTDGTDPRLRGGAIAPSASTYNGSFPVSLSTKVKARRLQNGVWSALDEETFLIKKTLTGLAISEIHYNAADGSELEFFELTNTGGAPLELGGVSVTGDVDFTFDVPTTLAPGAFVVVADQPSAFQGFYQTPGQAEYAAGIALATGGFEGNLSDGGGFLAFENVDGSAVLDLSFDDERDWPNRADGGGSSLERVDFARSASDPFAWSSSCRIHGTPGRGRSCADLRINEVDPAAGWVELFNEGTSAINLSGWSLQALAGSVPLSGSLAPGARTVVNLPAVNATGDLLIVTRPDGAGLQYVDDVDFGAPLPGKTFGIHERSDGETDFVLLESPSPQAANSAPYQSPFQITEVMANPVNGIEWIELHNADFAPLSLYDVNAPANTWKLTGAVDFTFPILLELQPCEVVILTSTNPAAFIAAHPVPAGTRVYGPWSGRLDNAGESIKLRQPLGGADVLVERVAYRPVAPWPSVPAGTAIERSVGSYANDPASWNAAAGSKTPGLRPTDCNTAPVLATIPNTNIDEQLLWTLPLTAVDPDQPVQTLQYTLEAGPPGLQLNAGGTGLRWNPTEAQGPGTYAVTVSVSDGLASDQRTFDVNVLEVNRSPVLSTIPNASINEELLWTYSLNATDPDLPAQTLVYAIDSGPPGLQLNAAGTGLRWTPTEAQGPGTYTVTVSVSDGITSSPRSFEVDVREVNRPPVITAIPDATINEELFWNLPLAAVDPDLPTQPLVYSIDAGPAGLFLNGAALRWRPTEAQGPGSYSVTVSVSDGITSSQRSFDVDVRERNLPPVLSVANQSIPERVPWTFSVAGSDPDVPQQSLTPSLVAGPLGLSLVGDELRWTPSEAQGPGTYTVSLELSDGVVSTPASFQISVLDVNENPAFANQTPLVFQVDERERWMWRETATDADGDSLSYQLIGAPAAAFVDPVSGWMRWIPDESRGGTTTTFDLVASDGNGGSSSREIRLVVAEREDAPGPCSTDVTLVAGGSDWSWSTTATGADWKDPWTDHSGFNAGMAPLGYGEPDLGTILPNNITRTVFVQSFTVPKVAELTQLVLHLRRDDGAIVYLNGIEVARDNLPPGTLNETTLASSSVFGAGEQTYHPHIIDPAALAEGPNLLAIAVHQIVMSSNDMVFDARLEAVRTACPLMPPQIEIEPYLTVGKFGFDTDIGARYEIQSCDNLVVGQWISQEIMVASSSRFTFTDQDSPLHLQRFYRVRRLP